MDIIKEGKAKQLKRGEGGSQFVTLSGHVSTTYIHHPSLTRYPQQTRTEERRKDGQARRTARHVKQQKERKKERKSGEREFLSFSIGQGFHPHADNKAGVSEVVHASRLNLSFQSSPLALSLLFSGGHKKK